MKPAASPSAPCGRRAAVAATRDDGAGGAVGAVGDATRGRGSSARSRSCSALRSWTPASLHGPTVDGAVGRARGRPPTVAPATAAPVAASVTFSVTVVARSSPTPGRSRAQHLCRRTPAYANSTRSPVGDRSSHAPTSGAVAVLVLGRGTAGAGVVADVLARDRRRTSGCRTRRSTSRAIGRPAAAAITAPLVASVPHSCGAAAGEVERARRRSSPDLRRASASRLRSAGRRSRARRAPALRRAREVRRRGR